MADLSGAGSLVSAIRLLRADAPVGIMGVPEDWPRWRQLLPHVLAATGHLPEDAAGPEGAVGDDVAWLLDRAAAYLQVLGQPAAARPLAERALAISEAAHGPDHPHVGIRLSNLAWILRDLGEPAAARPLAERALAVAEAALGPDNPRSHSLHDLARRLQRD
jgi:hypothetical protein